ncbi:MAG: radical SAM protein [Candidatus Thermoplasmatota archaeon]|nr:radical SAM protein [Candidatus Thermoplasmatota archaeon]
MMPANGGQGMRVLIIDGYVDEPGNLGVPPYFGIYPRYLAGAAESAGAEADYFTIDDWRGEGIPLEGYDAAAIIGGTAVPGKYLAAMPASPQELERLFASLFTKRFPIVPVGPMTACTGGDPVARFHDIIKNGEAKDRKMTMAEWNDWAVRGALLAKKAFRGKPMMAEVETYRGCVRYFTGGCSFCIEPSKGKPVFRKPKDVVREIKALCGAGMEHIRLGGQTCIFSYMADGVGKTETPKPSPESIEELFSSIKKSAPDLRTLHVDNGNPAVIAENLKEARKVAHLLVEYCTSGNVVALGLESADPVVAKENNLNSTADQAFKAIKLLNEVGGERGENGLPKLLPGINFLGGLKGETQNTYKLNLAFLESILLSKLLIRRINVRQVKWQSATGRRFFDRTSFLRFKEAVRERIDNPMLSKLVPEGTVLREVYTELHDGNTTFGRQMGSYPLLVGIPYKMDLGVWLDVTIVGHGKRSVTGVEHPINVNTANVRALEALPGIGRKRALRLFHKRPMDNWNDVLNALDDEDAARRIEDLITF